MADAEPPFEQRLRAEGAEQRELHGGGHEPPDTEAAGEGSVNLTKQALRSPCRRLSARVRSATRSSRLSESRRSTSEAASGSTAASLSLCEAASAVASASSPSFLRAFPVES